MEVRKLESKSMLTAIEEQYEATIKAIHKGVENTDLVGLLTTHHSQLQGVDNTNLVSTIFVFMASHHITDLSDVRH